MNEKKLPGARILKTTIAVTISLILSRYVFNFVDYNMTVAVILSMRQTTEKTIEYGKNRIFGTLLGGVFGFIALLILKELHISEDSLITLFINVFCMFVLLWITKLMELGDVIASMGCVIFFSITMLHFHEESILPYVFSSVIAAIIGVIIATIINFIDFDQVNKRIRQIALITKKAENKKKEHNIDGISFFMKDNYDFSFLEEFGRVFTVFADNDSGNISFGVINDDHQKQFIKIAGLKTIHSIISRSQAVDNLKQAVKVYEDLQHPTLIQLLDHFEKDEMYIAIFEWVDGECLFDYWNFDVYKKNPLLVSPAQKFKKLSLRKKLEYFQTIFDFLLYVEEKGYIAIDFYDGSLLVDFDKETITICDIDLFKKKPVINDIGEEFWGSTRLKSPEEYQLNEAIDARTNVFTLGALLFHYFGNYSKEELAIMKQNKAFQPCDLSTFFADVKLYQVLLKAVNPCKEDRYSTIKDFYAEMSAYLKKITIDE